MSEFSIRPHGDVWHLEGKATLFALSRDKQVLKTPKPESGIWCVDCAKLDQIDTAGLAYLLECVRHAKSQGVKLSIQNLPKAVMPLAQAQGVKSILEDFIQ